MGHPSATSISGTPRVATGVLVVALQLAAPLAWPRPPEPLSSYTCGEIDRALSKSHDAFTAQFDSPSIQYPARDALKTLRQDCAKAPVPLGEVRKEIETRIRESLASDPSRFTVAVVSYSWCAACADAFTRYKAIATHDPDVRFVMLEGDAYDGVPDPSQADYAFNRFLSRLFDLTVPPGYPGYVVMDKNGAVLRGTPENPVAQSFYGEQGFKLAMKSIEHARKSRPRP
jgi:hypothetical protein